MFCSSEIEFHMFVFEKCSLHVLLALSVYCSVGPNSLAGDVHRKMTPSCVYVQEIPSVCV